MADDPVSNEAISLPKVKLYSPGALAAYFILGNIPIGMALYALNVARRGDRWIGYMLFASSAVALVLLVLAAAAGRNLRGWNLLALVVGLGVWRVEQRPYRQAIRNGAFPERWWPPLVAVLALMILLVLLVPEE
jgi:hypothetical protein